MPATLDAPKPSSLGEAVAAALGNFTPAAPDPALPAEPKAKEPEPTKEVAKEPPAAKAPEKEIVPQETINPNLAAPKKAESKAPLTEDDDAHEKGMTKEARDWAARTRKERDAAVKQVESFAAEREALETKVREAAASAPEIVRLKAELEEMKKTLAANEDEISIARVEGTKHYKEAVAGPMSEVNEITARLGAAYELSATAILDAIKETDPAKRADAIEEITSGFKAYDRDELIGAAKTYAKAQKIAEDMRGNAKKRLEEITSRSKLDEEGAQTAATDEYRAALVQEWKALQAKYPELRPVDGAQPWNEHLARIERDAQAVDVNNISAAEVAAIKAQASALPEMRRVAEHYQKREKELTAELEKAEARIKEYVGTEPGAGSGQNGSGAVQQLGAGGTTGERVMQRVGAVR